MNNLMVDLETLGTKPTSVFLSLAVVPFNIHTGEVGKPFYRTIKLEDAIRKGRTIDASTLQWWMSQDADIRYKMFVGGCRLVEALNHLNHYIGTVLGLEDPFVWGNSASFDLGMLGDAYDQLGMRRPWNFRNERCYRTIISEFPPDIKFDRVDAHDPVEDCKHQIKKLVYVMRKLKTTL